MNVPNFFESTVNGCVINFEQYLPSILQRYPVTKKCRPSADMLGSARPYMAVQKKSLVLEWLTDLKIEMPEAELVIIRSCFTNLVQAVCGSV